MATLNTLRTKGGLIVSIVIGIALVAFLLGDFAGGNSVFSSKVTVGEINGKGISYVEYSREVDYLTNVNKIISGSDALSQEQQDGIKNFAWENMINNYAVYPGFEKLGVEVTEDEMFDLIYGNNISPVLLGAGFFNNPQTGAYDKAMVKNFVTNLASDQTGNMRVIWQYLQDQVRNQALISKYIGLMTKMVYVTDVEVAQGVQNSNNFYNARYVGQTYESVSDSTISVSKSEIKKYYDEHKNYFKQAASRDVEYVVFDVLPSPQDYADAAKAVESIATDFAAAENVQQFVTLNSQEQFDARYYSKEQLPAALGEFIFSGDKGMYGPVLEGDVYTLARVNSMRSIPDTIAIRQMILAPGSDNLADSLMTVLKGGADFNTIAAQYSAAPAGNNDMGRVGTNMLPQQITDPIFASSDRIVKISNPNGIVLLDVYYRGPESLKAQIGTIKYIVEPSTTTQQIAYAKASKFTAAVANKYENFNKTITDSVYSKRVARVRSTDNTISGLDNSRELIRWAFTAEKGDISSIMEIDGNYIVSSLATIREDGFAPIDQVSNEIASAVRREKKADVLAAKMAGAQSIDALAQTLNAKAGEVTELNFNTFFIPEIGVDPTVIGAICGGAKEGALSKPIKGITGVYVVNVTSKDTRTDVTPAAERVRLEAVNQNYIDQRAMQAMQDLSGIIDTRVKYF